MSLRLLEASPVTGLSAAESGRRWRAHRAANGRSAGPLLTPPDGNPKLHKASAPTYGLTLLPARLSGVNLCPASTPECRRGCLNTAGRGGMSMAQEGRRIRTAFLQSDPAAFVGQVTAELSRAVAAHGAILFRPNVLSDIAWEQVAPEWFGIDGVTLYDYTKRADRAESLPYALAYSASERTDLDDIRRLVGAGARVSVVADYRKGEPKPTAWYGMPAVDADASDEWILTAPAGTVGLLTPKGDAKALRVGWDRFVKPSEGA